MSSVQCSAERKLKTPSNHIEVKLGTTYKVKTGYKIYATAQDFASGTVKAEQNGLMTEFVWSNAVVFAAGAALFTAMVAF